MLLCIPLLFLMEIVAVVYEWSYFIDKLKLLRGDVHQFKYLMLCEVGTKHKQKTVHDSICDS